MKSGSGPQVKRRGNSLGMAIFRTSLRIFGLTGTYGLLYFVAFYYLVFDRAAVDSSMAYIKRRFRNYGAFRRMISVFRLFISQGRNLIDRYYQISGHGSFDIEIQGYEKLQAMLGRSPKGILLLTAHVGNWQLAMTALEKLGKTVYLVMRPEDNAAVRETLNIDASHEKIKIISSEGFLGGVVEIMAAIDNSGIVSIMGDRNTSQSSSEAILLGQRAHLPHGAFTIALAAQCPVVVLLSARVSDKKYIVDVSNVIEPVSGPRSQRQVTIDACVQCICRNSGRVCCPVPVPVVCFQRSLGSE